MLADRRVLPLAGGGSAHSCSILLLHTRARNHRFAEQLVAHGGGVFQFQAAAAAAGGGGPQQQLAMDATLATLQQRSDAVAGEMPWLLQQLFL